MKFIDITEWKRAEHYNFFQTMDYPQYNICMNIDITNFLEQIKGKRLPFYYAMIYACVSTANEIEEFKYRIREGKVVLHERIHPSFTVISPDSELFKIVTVELQGTLEEFVSEATQKVGNQQTYFPPKELAGRDDLIYITCIPWISFTHISHTIQLRKEDAVPRISWGKYYKEGEKILLPFSVQVNHSFVDGIHVGRYVDMLQKYLDSYHEKRDEYEI